MLQGARVKTVCGSVLRGECVRGDSRLPPIFPPPHPLCYFYLYNIRGGRGTNDRCNRG